MRLGVTARWLFACFVLAMAMASNAHAIMAGMVPDSPTARVDPNVVTSPFAGVGSVLIGSGVYSGVVIAPEYVLTAGHVGAAAPAASMRFMLNVGSVPWASAIESVTIYPTYNFPNDDLAILKLGTPVPPSVPIYSMYAGALAQGLPITLAGYGASGNGDVGATVAGSATVKRVGQNALDSIRSSLAGGGVSRFFVYDFDGPTGNGLLGGPTLGNAQETLVASGDSGGPAFVTIGGLPQLLGINTFVGNTNYQFGATGGGILASDPRFAAWLQAVTQGTMPGQQVSADQRRCRLEFCSRGAKGIGSLEVCAACAG